MNRKRLEDLIFETIRNSRVSLNFGEPSQLTNDLSDALWPILGQLWDEAYRTGKDDTDPMAPGTANPYKSDA